MSCNRAASHHSGPDETYRSARGHRVPWWKSGLEEALTLRTLHWTQTLFIWTAKRCASGWDGRAQLQSRRTLPAGDLYADIWWHARFGDTAG